MGADEHPARRPLARTAVVLTVGAVALFALSLASLMYGGSSEVSLTDVWNAIFHYDPDMHAQMMVYDIRIPRVLATALVGASFAMAGAIMQGATRNPLADSGIMGINAGAALGIALSYAFFPEIPILWKMLAAFAGASVATAVVNLTARSRMGASNPVRLVLAGMAVGILFTSLSQGVALAFNVSGDIMYWTVGSVASVSWAQLTAFAPLMIVALLCGCLLSRYITAISLGEEVATGLGVNTGRIMLLATLVVLVLAGTSVAIVGAVAFVGLVAPHFARRLVGSDYRHIIPCSAIIGGMLLVAADLFSRNINPPDIVPLGAVAALIGVPFFLYLARTLKEAS